MNLLSVSFRETKKIKKLLRAQKKKVERVSTHGWNRDALKRPNPVSPPSEKAAVASCDACFADAKLVSKPQKLEFDYITYEMDGAVQNFP